MSRHPNLAREIRNLRDRLTAQEEEIALLRGELRLNERVADIVERELDLLGEEVDALHSALAALRDAPLAQGAPSDRIAAGLMRLPAPAPRQA